MDKDTYLKHLLNLGERWREEKTNLVVVTAEAGAGHLRQAYYLKRLADLTGTGGQMTMAKVDLNSSRVTGVLNEGYKRLQNLPWVYEAITRLMNGRGWRRAVDFQLRKMDFSDQLEEAIEASRNYDPNRPTIVISTHSAGAVSAVSFMRKRQVKGWLVEYVPDPWRGGQLLAMTCPPGGITNHLVVVHDSQTADEYRRLRGDRNQVLVLGWGTLSNPDYWFLPPGRRKYPWHLGIEFSGNRIPVLEDKISRFLILVTGELRQDKVRLSIMAMHHTDTARRMREVLRTAGLTECSEIITGEDIGKAVYAREEILLGRGRFGSLDAVITKGGEVPLEDRRGMTVAAVYGAGHEGRDIETGVKEGPVIDLRLTDESEWWREIKKAAKPAGSRIKDLRSRALLALWRATDEKYFRRII